MIDSAPMRPARIRLAMIAAVCAVALAGCGGGGSNGQSARDVAQQYVDARNQGDAAKVCELYSDQLKSKLKTSNCAEFVKEQTSGATTTFMLLAVHEDGDQATATIRATNKGGIGSAQGEIQIRLAQQDGRWRIMGVPPPGDD